MRAVPSASAPSGSERGLEAEPASSRRERARGSSGDRVRRPASAPQTRPVSAASSASAPTRSASAASSPASSACAGGSKPRPGRAGGEEVEVLGPADGAAVDGLDVDQAGLAQPLEVQPDGVGVQAEALGEVLGREGGGRAGQLLVHRVAGLVAQGLEDRELPLRFAPVHGLTVPAGGHIFKM